MVWISDTAEVAITDFIIDFTATISWLIPAKVKNYHVLAK